VGHHFFRVKASGYNEVAVPADVDEGKVNEVVAELGSATELWVSVTLQGPIREAVGTDDLIIASGKMLILVQNASSEQLLEPEKTTRDAAIFRIGKDVGYVVKLDVGSKLSPQSSFPETISAVSEPVSIATGTSEPVRAHLTLGGDCQVVGVAPADQCVEVFLEREGSVAPGGAQNGANELGYTVTHSTYTDDEDRFAFGALLPGVYSAYYHGRDAQGYAKTYKAQVVLSQPGELAQIQWK
jgi:hypothetical protein